MAVSRSTIPHVTVERVGQCALSLKSSKERNTEEKPMFFITLTVTCAVLLTLTGLYLNHCK